MHAVGALGLDKRIAAVIELRYVSAKVLDQRELSSWVLPFIAVCVEDEVVENDELFAALHLDINHLRRVHLHICYVFVARVGQLVLRVDSGKVVAACLSAVEIFADQDQVYEEEEAANAGWDILGLLEVSEAVSDGTTKDDHIGVKENEIADPAMDLRDNGCFLFLGPLLVAVVEAVVGLCDEPGY